MKLDNVSPQWAYNTEGDALSEIINVQLLLWSQGLCISGHDAQGNTLIAKAFAYESRMADHVLNTVFMNEPLLAGPQPIHKIWIATDRNIIIPQHLYQQPLAEAWLPKVHFVETDEIILHQLLTTPNATAVYPLKQNLQTAFEQFFPEANIHLFIHLNKDCGTNAKDFNAHLVLLGSTAILSIEHQGKLLAQQQFNYSSINDLAYQIGLAAQHHNVAQNEVGVFVSGILTDLTQASNELQTYFAHTQLCDESEPLTFLTRLSQCVS
jgi:hypothetical protein